MSEEIQTKREQLYSNITQKFTSKEKQVINKLLGRNSEIGYLFLQASKFLDIDLVDDIEKVMQLKQDEEEISDSYYFELIKEIFEKELANDSEWLLHKGEFAGYRYFPKTSFYMKLIARLKEHNLSGIGTPKFNGLLKDIGFMTNYNIKNQKNKEGMPVPCLIFSRDVIEKLNSSYEPLIIAQENIK